MPSTPEQPILPARRGLVARVLLVALNLALAAAALWLGMAIPSYFRSVSPLVLEAAAAGSPGLLEQADEQLQAGRPGLAGALLQAHAATGAAPDAAATARLRQLLEANPRYRWSGGPAPFYEQFLELAPHLRADETAVIPALLPAAHRQVLLRFLRQSPNQNVHHILGTRELAGWQRFYPVYSTSGHPLEATVLAAALLEQAGALPDGLRRGLLDAIAAAGESSPADPRALEEIESIYIGLLTLGRHADWLQLRDILGRLESTRDLLFVTKAVQEDPARLALTLAALRNSRATGPLIAYLLRHRERGWESLTTALGMGRGAVEALVQFDKPVYHPPRLWRALPQAVRGSQEAFKGFAETMPGIAIAARAAAFALCGFFLVGVLRVLVLRRPPRTDQRRRVLINLDSLVGGVLVMLLVWVMIEPGLLEFRPNEQGTLQIRLARILPQDTLSPTESESASAMIDQVTILILLLFLVMQLLVFIFGLLKIADVRRQAVPAEVKIRLLDNEDSLFDLGLYVGLGGTVASLILVVLNFVDASLMAAYASTLFGIIFVAILKVGFLRPFRRQLILLRNSEPRRPS
jgi:hypothetical protein